MAFASDSTSAPARPLLPLPAPDRGAIGRDGWARARQLAARLGGAVRDHLAEGLRQAWRAARGPRVDAPCDLWELIELTEVIDAGDKNARRARPAMGIPMTDYPDAIGEVADTAADRADIGMPMTARAELPPEPLLSTAEAGIPVSAHGWAEVTALRAAHALHLRRRLEAAAEHGAALLSALGLPQLAALDDAIALLDALDGDPDMEDDDPVEAEPDEHSLGWPEDVAAHLDAACAADPDAELDDADLEEDHRAAWPAVLQRRPPGEARP